MKQSVISISIQLNVCCQESNIKLYFKVYYEDILKDVFKIDHVTILNKKKTLSLQTCFDVKRSEVKNVNI